MKTTILLFAIAVCLYGCGTGISPEAEKPNYDSIYVAENDSIKQSVEDSLGADSVIQALKTQMNLKQKFDSIKK